MPKPNVTHQIRINICADDFFDLDCVDKAFRILKSPRPGMYERHFSWLLNKFEMFVWRQDGSHPGTPQHDPSLVGTVDRCIDSGLVDVTIVPRERLVLYEVTYGEDDGDANEERRLLFDNAADARAAAEWVKSTESFLSSPDEIYVTNITGQVRSSWSDPEPADAELLFGLRMDTTTEGGE